MGVRREETKVGSCSENGRWRAGTYTGSGEGGPVPSGGPTSIPRESRPQSCPGPQKPLTLDPDRPRPSVTFCACPTSTLVVRRLCGACRHVPVLPVLLWVCPSVSTPSLCLCHPASAVVLMTVVTFPDTDPFLVHYTCVLPFLSRLYCSTLESCPFRPNLLCLASASSSPWLLLSHSPTPVDSGSGEHLHSAPPLSSVPLLVHPPGPGFSGPLRVSTSTVLLPVCDSCSPLRSFPPPPRFAVLGVTLSLTRSVPVTHDPPLHPSSVGRLLPPVCLRRDPLPCLPWVRLLWVPRSDGQWERQVRGRVGSRRGPQVTLPVP